AGELLERELAWWCGQLEGAPQELELPADRPRPAVQSFRGALAPIRLPEELTAGLRQLARDREATLFMTLLAAFQVQLGRLCGRRDFLVATPIANRNHAAIEPLIGFFVNTLLLRANLEENPTFGELLARVRRTTLDAYAHQDLPLERLIDELQPERKLSTPPVFQVMFAFQNAPLPPLTMPGLTIEPFAVDTGTAKFDLTINVWESAGRIEGTAEYNADLFDVTTVRRLLGWYAVVLEAMAASPERRI
ncbi:MAG: non-ribosomal peptide synthetase, partial [bacterium]|nr:non-ribosomal peptide synthetase [bacterium]